MRSIFGIVCLVSVILASVAPPALALPREKERWVVAEREHFTVVSNASTRRTRNLVGQLERFREIFATYSSGIDMTSSVETKIFIFKNPGTFAEYSPSGGGTWVGYFQPAIDGNYIAVDASAEDPLSVIYGSYVHHIVENNIAHAPAWLSYGLAELYSTFEVLGGKINIGRPSDSAISRLSHSASWPLGEFVEVESRWLNRQSAETMSAFEANAWALMHMLLISDPSLRERMPKLLATLHDGKPSGEALSLAYGRSLAELNALLQAYILKSEFGMFRITPAEPFDEESVAVRDLSHAETLAQLGDLLAHFGPTRIDAADKHLAAAIEFDPKLAAPWESRAFALHSADRNGEADTACNEALKRNPESGRAHAIKGMVLFNRFEAQDRETIRKQVTSRETPPLLAEARIHFRKSLERMPDHPVSLAGLGASYLYGEEDVDEGLQALAKAVKQSPGRNDLQAQLVVLTAKSGDLAGAYARLERGLRPNAEQSELYRAEVGVMEAVYRHADTALREGDGEEAQRLISELRDHLSEASLQSDATMRLAQLGSLAGSPAAAPRAGEAPPPSESIGDDDHVGLFNRAVTLANGGEFDEAAELLERVAAGSGDAGLALQARTFSAEVRQLAERSRHVDHYNAAIGLAQAGKLQEAADSIEALLADDPDQELREAAEQTLEQMREGLKR